MTAIGGELRTPRVAFYTVHPFEFLHFEPLRKHLRDAEYVVGDADVDERREAIHAMNARGIPCVDIATADVTRYGVCVVRHHTRGAWLSPIDTRRVRLVDRYTNENNETYGPANAVYDAVLSCGPWATRHLEACAPCVEVGNPRLEAAFGDEVPAGRSATDKLRVVYFAPTAETRVPPRDPEPDDPYCPYLRELSRRCELIIKLGGDSARFSAAPVKRYADVSAARVLAPEEDAIPFMRSSSVVVAPFSDAVFEALAFRIPVVLCGDSADTLRARGRCLLSLDACEDRRLHRGLGVHNLDPERLVDDVFEAFGAGPVAEPFLTRFADPKQLDGGALLSWMLRAGGHLVADARQGDLLVTAGRRT